MSDTPSPKPATPPPAAGGPTESRTGAPPSAAPRPATAAAASGTSGAPAAPQAGFAWRRLDPAALGLMLGAAGVVLLLALWWLWATPRAADTAAADAGRLAQIEQRLGGLDAAREQAGAANARIQALEGRLGSQAGELDGRLRALEQRAATVPDLSALASRQALEALGSATAQRLTALEHQAAQALAVLDQRVAAADQQATQRLAGAAQGLEQRIAGLGQQLEQRTAALAQQLEQRTTALGQQVEQRTAALDQRVAELRQQLDQRLAAAEQQAAQRAAAAEQQATQRIGALENALGQRIAALEQAQQRLAGLEARVTRAAAIDGLQSALEAGQPLGPMLARLQDPPQPLARYAGAAPPTLASLRLSFDEAARAARHAPAEPRGGGAGAADQQQRPAAVDSALARLGGLVTVRRGDQLVWGDQADAEIEKARRQLEAGDLDGAIATIEAQPPGVRQAMQSWTEQAKALAAARAALRQLATTTPQAG